MNDKRCYENARDTTQFNGMNVSSRKTNNPSYKRDPNAIHYTSYSQSSGNLHDGMNYPGSNSLTLQSTAAPVTVQPANTQLSQHTSQYLQSNSLPVAAPGHPSAYHLTAHVPVTSTQTIPIPTHSQGPTPSSTPPAGPNDSKGSHQYAQHNYPTMNHIFRPVPSQPVIVNSRNHGNTRIPQAMPARAHHPPLFYISNSAQQYFIPQPIPNLGQMNGGNLLPSQYPLGTSSSPEQHSPYFPPIIQTPSTQPYNTTYSGSRGHWNNPNRTASQGGVQLQHNSMIQNNPMYSNLSTVPIAPPQTQQPQPQQQQPPQQPQPTHLQSRTKRRTNALPIINPLTLQEVNVDGDNDANDEQNAKSKETMEAESRTRSIFVNEIKKVAQEPSSRSIASTQSSVSSSTNLKESTTSGSINGAPTSVTTIAQPITIISSSSVVDRKPSSHPSSSTNNQNASTISDCNIAIPNDTAGSALSEKPAVTQPPTASVASQPQPPATKPATPIPVHSPVHSEDDRKVTISAKEEKPTHPPQKRNFSGNVGKEAASIESTSSADHQTSSGAKNKSAQSASKHYAAEGPKSSNSNAQSSAVKSNSETGEPAIDYASQAETRTRSIFVNEIKKGAQEPSSRSIVPTQSYVSSSTNLKESATSGSINGVSLPVATIAQPITIVPLSSTVDCKPSSHPSLSTNNQNASTISDSNVTAGSVSAEKSAVLQPPAASVASQPPATKAATSTLHQSSAHPEDDRKVTVSAKEEKPTNQSQKRNRGGGGGGGNASKETTSNETSGSTDHQTSSGTKNKSAQSASKYAAESSKSNSSNAQSSATKSNGENAEPATESNKTTMSRAKKKNKKDSNKKNSEKDNVDTEASVEKAPPLTEKNQGRSSEKASQQQPSQNAITNVTNTSSNASSRKTNSSQKSAAVIATSISNETKDNVNIIADSKEKVQVEQNIPAVSKLTATQAPSNIKTESVASDETPPKRKKYTVEEILSYRYLPQCKQRVKLNPDVPLMVDASYACASRSMSQNGYSAANSFMPSFAHQHPHQAPSRLSMGGSGRKSQQGMRRDRPPQPIHVSLSLKDDVPLRQSKDAWKPSRLNQDRNVDEETKKTEELNKSVRGILNKLTPEKFPTLIEKINSLPIDNVSRLEGVIDLIFQKAIDEPGFCRSYAEMCRVMQTLSVLDETTNKQETFRKILLNKCQNEFQREKAAELDSVQRQAEIKACNDPEKKKELQLEFEEMERKLRRKSVGNCRFIGELFKFQMLTAKIMMRCVSQLLSNLEEESLECLCKLLTTIGKDLETKLGPTGRSDLDTFFNKMQEIISDKKNKVSSRIRFMLQDVIDLRRMKWVPRREADNPKTIDQMNMEFERKEQDIKLANMLPRDKPYDDYGRNRDFKKNPKNEKDEWQTVPNKSNFSNKSNQKFDLAKLNAIKIVPSVGESLGPQTNHSAWRLGVSSGSKSVGSGPMHSLPSLSTRSSVRLTPSNSTEKPRPFAAISREDDTKMSRSGSTQSVRPVPSRENSVQRAPSSRNASQSGSLSSAPPQLDRDVLERYCKTILEEFALNNNIGDSIIAFEERINPQQLNVALECFINVVLEKSRLTKTCGRLFAALFKRKLINLSNILNLLSTFIENSEDVLIDYPHFWDYLAETLSYLFIEDCLKYSEFETAFVEKLSEQRGGPLLLAVNEILNKHVVSNKPSLSEYLTKNISSESFENMKVWINANVGKVQNNEELVAALTKAVCEYFYSFKEELSDDKFLKIFSEKFFRYFKFYVENDERLEMICLEAVADYARDKAFPKGFLLNMCKSLYDSKCVSPESFLTWRQQYNHPLSGVVFTSLNQFFQCIEE